MREVLTLHPPVDILLLLLSSMSGRREGWEMEEWLASNEPVRYLASNDGDAIIKTKKKKKKYNGDICAMQVVDIT